MAYPVYTVGSDSTLYPIATAAAAAAAAAQTGGGGNGGGTQQAQQQYYATAAAGGATVGYATTGPGGQYVVQHAVDAEALMGNRVSPQTTGAVQWLLENYETAEGVSLPRSTLYAHYLRHCAENKLEPVNAASFGKLIRSVFLGLRTRRLGTRGNSKYHYYGIRVKPGSSLMNMEESSDRMVLTASGSNSGKAHGTVRPFKRNSDSNDSLNSTLTQHASFLGDGSSAIPAFPEIRLLDPLPEECVSYEDVDTLKSIYREHLEAFLDAILSLEFATVESLWREFWRSQYNNNSDECEEEKYLSKAKLFCLCSYEPVQQFMRQVDLVFYQNLIQVLVPDVLKPIPATLTQSIRNFAKS
ncbi:unnamed protein product [Callosobruchus maculatus]|uniref:RFX-type winged-helix domain-containing protein n=1 Tax=Callosobruchus maculatus TaxID=64391 RepID=A0A653CJE2_CALMS|nr:unnamed protein product [Callosobruchus maculatus]